MTIVVTGGGSGGHITPVLAVAHEIKKASHGTKVVFVGQKGDALNDIPASDKSIDRVQLVRAGKFRRYHGESFWSHLVDYTTLLKNIRDAFWVVVGIWQSFELLKKLKPDVIFIKGGFVGVPVGLAAAVLRIPYVTHDSDALPGLANRIIARWARLHTVALPKEVYSYPADKTVTVGVPISHNWMPLKEKEQLAARRQLKLEDYKKIVLVTGGGLGAQSLNSAITACAPELLARYDNLAIVHITGRGKDKKVRQEYKNELSSDNAKHIVIRDFVNNLHQYSAAADIVVTRAGGSIMAEMAAQAKACIVVPNPVLAGGHQLKNARVLADRKVVRFVDEDVLKQDPKALMPPLTDLLDHPETAKKLSQNLAKLARPDAAYRLAMLLLEIQTKDQKRRK